MRIIGLPVISTWKDGGLGVVAAIACAPIGTPISAPRAACIMKERFVIVYPPIDDCTLRLPRGGGDWCERSGAWMNGLQAIPVAAPLDPVAECRGEQHDQPDPGGEGHPERMHPGVPVEPAKLKVADVPVTLVTVRVRLVVRDMTGPKAMVAGSRVAATFMASAALSLPAPTALTPAVVPSVSVTSCVAVFTTADLSCAGVQVRCICFTSATAPATIGTA